MEPIIGAGGGGSAADAVKDSDTENFMVDVIEASDETPIVVDFWAPWCGPCKQLGPAIENAVRATAGAVKLVRINVDENKELAAQFRVQSIPAVYAFHRGRPVDGFVGALPESQIKSFVGRLASAGGPNPIEAAMEQAAAALENGETDMAAQIYGEVLRMDGANAAAIAGLARCALAKDDLAEARDILDSADPSIAKDSAITSARSALDLAEQAAATRDQSDGGGSDALERQLQADPDNHQTRFDLAMARFAAGDKAAAVDHLLEIIRRDRAWNEDAARLQLLKFFEAFGHTDPVTVDGRRKLSSMLFS